MIDFTTTENAILTVLVEAEKHSISEYFSKNHEEMDEVLKDRTSEYLGKILGILDKLKEAK